MSRKKRKKGKQQVHTSVLVQPKRKTTNSEEETEQPDLINRKNVLLIWLIASVVLLFFWYFLPHDSFYSEDSGVKLIQIENLISNNFTDISLKYNGQDIDPTLSLSPFQLKPNLFIKNKKNYSIFPILFPFLSSFFYSKLGYAGLYLIPLLCAILSFLLIYGISSHFLPRRESLITMLVTGFSTPIFFYSLTFWEHVPAVFLFLLSLYLFLNIDRNLYTAIGAGLILGIAIWFRSEMIILYLLLFMFGFIFLARKKVLLLFSIGTLLSSSSILFFNKLVYGEWFGHITRNLDGNSSDNVGNIIHYKFSNLWTSLFGLNMPQTIPQKSAGWEKSFSLIKSNVILETLWFFAIITIILLSIVQHLKNTGQVEDKDTQPRNIKGSSILTTDLFLLSILAILSCIYLISCFFDHSPLITVLKSGGLFTFSPFLAVLLLLPFGHFNLLSQERELKWLYWTSISFITVMPILAPNDGGIRYGARYLLPVIPLLTMQSFILCYQIRKRYKVKYLQPIIGGLVLLAFLVQMRGYQLLYYKKIINHNFTQALLEDSTERIGMTNWWMIFNSAPAMISKKMHILSDVKSLEKLIKGAKEAGENTVSIAFVGKTKFIKLPAVVRKKYNVKVKNQRSLILPYDTYFNFTIFSLEI